MQRGFIALVCGSLIMGAMPTHAQSVQQGDQRVRDIVGAGKVRIGVFPSTQYSKDTKTGEQSGLALAITRALTSRLGITEVSTVEHPNPVAVVACVKAGECDLGFVSIEPARLAEVDFTPPYIRRDFTYLVPANSSVRGVDDADRPGIRIATVTGHASTTALVRVLKQAKPVYADDLDPAFELLRAGGADALASVREVVLRYAARLPGSRVLDDSYDSSLVAIAIQKGRTGWLSYVSEFLADVKRSGWLRKTIDSGGLRGFEVVVEKVPQ
jgi:polar amino acid transport system substrate-binding protein